MGVKSCAVRSYNLLDPARGVDVTCAISAMTQASVLVREHFTIASDGPGCVITEDNIVISDYAGRVDSKKRNVTVSLSVYLSVPSVYSP